MKTLNFKIILLSLAAVFALGSCRYKCIKGSGREAAENLTVANFTEINVKGGYHIILKQDSSLYLNITADDNVLKLIRTEVDGDKLRISTKRNICAERPITITIGIKRLEAIEGSGAIELENQGKLNVNDLKLKFSGASKVNLDLSANNVTTEGSGATEINLKGQATSHSVHLTGSGKLYALDFIVDKYDLETTGASECKINVLNELNTHTTGAADIEYRGNPAHVNNSKVGAAEIKKID